MYKVNKEKEALFAHGINVFLEFSTLSTVSSNHTILPDANPAVG